MSAGAGARLAHLLLALAGLAAIVYGFTFAGSTAVSCRGVPMGPGAVCRKADNSAGQTYEQRLATRRAAGPVVVGVGVVVAAFGTVLLVGDRRRRRPSPGSPVEEAG